MLLNVEEFIKRFAPGVLKYRGSPLVEGYPGAGKTTLAASICYSYAVKGERCLYTTFHEDKEKVFGVLSELGVDLASAEKKGGAEVHQAPSLLRGRGLHRRAEQAHS